MGRCVLDPTCFATLNCMAGCSGEADEAQCQFECEMTIGEFVNDLLFVHQLDYLLEHS